MNLRYKQYICGGGNGKTTSIPHSECRIPEISIPHSRMGPIWYHSTNLTTVLQNSTTQTVPRTHGTWYARYHRAAVRYAPTPTRCYALVYRTCVYAVAIATAGDMRFLVSRSVPFGFWLRLCSRVHS